MIYAVGDIHGHLDQLEAAHARIAEDRAREGAGASAVVHIGDLCDRGPDTKRVIQFLIDGIAGGEDWTVLRGNHDQMFLDFLEGGDGSHPRLGKSLTWQNHQLGGKETLASYASKKSMLESADKFHRRLRKAVPDSHKDFLKRLPYWHKAEGMIFVHAGIRPGFPLEAQDEEDLLWIRDDFLWHFGDHEALIVHGHTPIEEPMHYGNRVNIDTGAGWGNDVVPVVFDGGECYALRADGRHHVKAPAQRPKAIMRR